MLSKGIQIVIIALIPIRMIAQCDPNGMLLELQSTTEIEGLIRGSGGCVFNTTIGAGLSLSSGVLSATADGSETIVTAGAGITVTGSGTSASPYVVTNTGDLSTSNEGILGVNPGSANTAAIITNTSGGGMVTISGGSGIGITEITGSTSGTITITNTGDLSTSNEGILGVGAGGGNTATITTTTTGGNAVTISGGSGITITEATSTNGGTITIAASGGGAWLIGGNTNGSEQTIGTNDSYRLPFETAGVTRAYIDTDGDVNIGNGTTSDAKLEIEGISSGVCLLAGAGGSLSTGNAIFRGTAAATAASYFYAYDLDAAIVGGNLIGRIRNGSTTSANSNALQQVVVGGSSVGDPVQQFTVEGATTWVAGIDNSDADKYKVSYAALPGTSDYFTIDPATGNAGIKDASPEYDLAIVGTTGVGVPSGTTAQRPASIVNPVLRFNSTFGGFEIANPSTGVYYRLSATSTPTISVNQTIFGTGSSSSITGNDVTGQITVTSGAAPTSGAGAINVTYSSAYSSGATPRVIITPANDAAAAEITKFRIGVQNTSLFQINTPTAATAATTYVFNYRVTQ